MNGLCAADAVLIPMQCEYYALEGLSDLVQTVKKVRAHLNPRSRSKGCCARCTTRATRSRSRSPPQLEQHFGDKVYRTVIPRNVRLAEAPSYGVPALKLDADIEGRAGLSRARRRDAGPSRTGPRPATVQQRRTT